MLEVQRFLIFGSQIKIHKFLKIKNADRVLEVLFEISTAVHTTQNLAELYRVIHKSLAKILNADNFFIDVPRFPSITEDAEPVHLLCTEYPSS